MAKPRGERVHLTAGDRACWTDTRACQRHKHWSRKRSQLQLNDPEGFLGEPCPHGAGGALCWGPELEQELALQPPGAGPQQKSPEAGLLHGKQGSAN